MVPYPRLNWPLEISGSQYAPVAWADIPGWNDDDHLQAYKAFRTSCKSISAESTTPAADPKTQEWWAAMAPMQKPLETRASGEWWAACS